MIGKNICLIEELRKLKESSKEAVENLDSFSEFQNEFKEYMHIKKDIEDEFFDLIQAANKSKKSQLILVCGGVGDGKSHLISYFKHKHWDIIKYFDLHNDATESFYPQKTSVDTLNDILDDFSDIKLNCGKVVKMIIAINLGALNNFIDSEYQVNFKALKSYVEENKLLTSTIVNNTFDELSSFQFVNFSDYHMYTLTPSGPKSDYIKQMLIKITQPDNNNSFYKSYNANCTNCSLNYKCPIKANYEFLQKEPVQDQLIEILIEAMVKYKIIISTRALLNFLYEIIVSNELDTIISHNEFDNYVQDMEFTDYIDHSIINLLFEHRDKSNIFEAISELDPIHLRSEELDNIYIAMSTRDDITALFRNYLIMDNGYLYQHITDSLHIKDLLRKNKDSKENLMKYFVRFYKFRPQNDEIKLRDDTYFDYMNYLYYWNTGTKGKLKKLYQDVKDSIFNWNGEGTKLQISLFMGNKQLKYKIIQTLDLAPDLDNLTEIKKYELKKFLPFFILNYKRSGETDKRKTSGIQIDFSLYKLLMRIRDGYRPNKTDKNNNVKFEEFIRKILVLGSQNKELIFEEKIGEKRQKFKLFLDEEFEEYNFARMEE